MQISRHNQFARVCWHFFEHTFTAYWWHRIIASNRLKLEEESGILDFAEMFTSKPTFIWGISEMVNVQDDVIAFIVASNLAKK